MYRSHSGRYRHIVKVFIRGNGTDDFGQSMQPYLFLTKRGEVQSKNGEQVDSAESVNTVSYITVLMRYDDRIKNDHLIEWLDQMYEIDHIKPDEVFRDMVVTARVYDK